MRITFLVDNLPHPTLPLLTEHGLSLYIETDDFISGTSTSSVTEKETRILCDMGASGAYIKNAKALGIDLNACHWAFLSHAHADHTGGLGKWIAQFGHIPVYASHRIATDEYFSSRPKQVASQKSQVKSQCKVSAEASLLDYAEPQPDFMSEANKVEGRRSKVERQRFNDSAIQHSLRELRYIGSDLNLFHGHTPWFKPIEQNTWLTPHIALVHPRCNQYPKPLGNKYLTVVAGQKSQVASQSTTSTTQHLNDLTHDSGPFSLSVNNTSTSSGTVRDDFSHEIALAFVTEKGLVVVSSCSHHGALNTIASCMEFTGCNTLHAYVGGLHFVDSEEVIKETTDFINEWLRLYPNAQLYTGHCTCSKATSIIKERIPKCHIFYTGKSIQL